MTLADIGLQDGFGPDDLSLWIPIFVAVGGLFLAILRVSYKAQSTLEFIARTAEKALMTAESLDVQLNRDDDQGSLKGRTRRLEETTDTILELIKENQALLQVSAADRRQLNIRLDRLEERLLADHT